MIKGVVFDFDGTLVDSNKIKINTFYEVTKDIIGAEVVLNKILSSPEAGDRYSIFNALTKEFIFLHNIVLDAEKLSEKYTELCEYKISLAPEINGAFRALKELRSLGISIFISSATPEFTLKKIIKIRGWESFFDMVLGSPNNKLEHLQTILKENNFSKLEVMYVGDSEVDQNASLLAGCKFVGVGEDWSRFRSRPSILLNTLENFIFKLEL